MASRSSSPQKAAAAGSPDVDASANPSKLDAKKEPGKKGVMSKLKGFWKSLGLDAPTLITMAKGGLPPAIALAMYQSTPVAETYSTLGYLFAIISIISFAIMPRAKFIQNVTMGLIGVCGGAAVALLVIFCAVKARQHTTPTSPPSGVQSPTPGASLSKYNSSASAVCAIWLFFQVYAVNAGKAKFPALQIPVIMYSIFAIVACTYSPQFPTMTAGYSFVKRLLETFLTGFAIATGVSFLVFPVTVRTIALKMFAGYIGALQGGLKAIEAYLKSLEDPETFAKSIITATDQKFIRPPEATAVKAVLSGITTLHGKLQGDLPLAKREIALGKLTADDLKGMMKKIRDVMLPIVGMGAVMDIFERIAVIHGWTQHGIEDMSSEETERRNRVLSEWSANIKALMPSFSLIIEAMVEGLEHVALQLELKPRPKKAKTAKAAPKGASESPEEDTEAQAESTKPGDKGFADYLDQKSKAFYGGKQQALTDWCKRHGIQLNDDFFEHRTDTEFTRGPASMDEKFDDDQLAKNQRQLYLLLYMEFLLYNASRAILAFVHFADDLVESGALSKTRLIVPGYKRLKKWVLTCVKTDQDTEEENHGLGDIDQSSTQVDLGQSYSARKDPEHLPPTNTAQKFGDTFRAIPDFLRSPESAFGFRVACATMSIAIISFLHDTQIFFTQQRLLWSMIMIAISMTPTAGQSVFSFVLRIFGTVVAMVLSFLVWYIPDHKTPGIIVFVWLVASLGWYVPIKMPQFAIIGIISMVTLVLIIGYELEVRKIGKAAATSNGQEFLPITSIGPYRLATVSGGLFVAFIWTIIPYPISEHSQLRQNMGGALYLLANYYSIIHETVKLRMIKCDFAEDDPNFPGHKLQKMRIKVHSKQMLVISSLKNYSKFLKWEISFGGKFPKKQYDSLIQATEHITNYISLIGYASLEFSLPDPENNEWTEDFRRLMGSVQATSHEITSLLSLLSASITNGQPLPPYLKAPAPYGLSAKLQKLDSDILSVRHIAEPGYAAFAVMQISSRCIITELENLLKAVKEIVGELDFSFHVISTADSSETSSSETLTEKNGVGKNKND